MPRNPIVGGDRNTWGTVLNEKLTYLVNAGGINAASYGAKEGNTTAANTTALQAWLDAFDVDRQLFPAFTGTPPLVVGEFAFTQAVLPGGLYETSDELVLPPILHANMEGAVIRPQGLGAGEFVMRSHSTHASLYEAHITGLTIINAPNGIHINNNNLAAGHIIFERCTFDGIAGIAVWIENAQSTFVEFRDCNFLHVGKALKIDKCDYCVVEGGWVVPLEITTTEQSVFENRGKLVMRDVAMNPIPHTGTVLNPAWIANHHDTSVLLAGGRTGVVICDNVRFGGEEGSMAAVNNYAGPRPPAEAVRTQVTIRDGDASAADGAIFAATGTRQTIVRLFAVPNQLEVTGVSGVMGMPLIDFATTTPPTIPGIDGTGATITTHVDIAPYDGAYADWLPAELIQFANRTERHIVSTLNGPISNAMLRGWTITNQGIGAGAVLTKALPTGKVGMQVTLANVQSGAGTLYIERAVGDTIQGGTPHLALTFGQSVTLRCTAPGYWMQV